MLDGGFKFESFEITKREILASVSIVAVMILIGVLISFKISEHQADQNEIYNKAVAEARFVVLILRLLND